MKHLGISNQPQKSSVPKDRSEMTADPVEQDSLAQFTDDWRRRTQLEQKQLQQEIQSICATPPESSLPIKANGDLLSGNSLWLQWVQDEKIVFAPLKSGYRSTLWDTKQKNWRLGEDKTRFSDLDGEKKIWRQPPDPIKNNNTFWSRTLQLKLYPEQPSTAYLIEALDRRLGNQGTPPQQLLAIHHLPLRIGKDRMVKQTAALLSLNVTDSKKRLDTLLKSGSPAIAQLDFFSFTCTFLRTLLIDPENDKIRNYFLAKIPDTERYQLIRVNNERTYNESAFFPVERLSPDYLYNKLRHKSIVYCLDQMLQTWNRDERTLHLLDSLRQIQPATLITDILKDCERVHTLWQQIVPEESLAAYMRWGYSLRYRWFYPQVSLPVLWLPEGIETTLLKRLTSLQTVLRLWKPHQITGLKLLAVIQPQLAMYYQAAFDLNPPASDKPNTPLSRFKYLHELHFDKTDVKSYHHSTLIDLVSPEVLEHKQLYIAFSRSVWSQQAHSVKQALDQVKSWQQLSCERQIRKGLLKLDRDAQILFGLLTPCEQQALLAKLLTKHRTSRKFPSKAQQIFLFDTLVSARCHNLNLAPLQAIVTDARLKFLLEKLGKSLAALDLSGCNQLTPKIIQRIASDCPHLHYLKINQLNWESLILSDFPELLSLECNGAQRLTTLRFGYLPRLQRLSLQDNPVLLMLAKESLFTENTQPWRLPALRRLQINGSFSLKIINLWVEQPRALRWEIEEDQQINQIDVSAADRSEDGVEVVHCYTCEYAAKPAKDVLTLLYYKCNCSSCHLPAYAQPVRHYGEDENDCIECVIGGIVWFPLYVLLGGIVGCGIGLCLDTCAACSACSYFINKKRPALEDNKVAPPERRISAPIRQVMEEPIPWQFAKTLSREKPSKVSNPAQNFKK